MDIMEYTFINKEHPEYQLFSSPKSWLMQLFNDIKNATHYIYIETFRLNDDLVGNALGELLIERAASGIEIRLIVDSWGTRRSALLNKLEKKGVSIRYFKQLVFSFDFFTKNHERNHRKIVAIDDKIAYIGSANFSKYSLSWRESILRIETDMAKTFKKIFLDNYKISEKKIKLLKYYKTINLQDLHIIREAPSIIHQKTRNYFLKLIKNAKKSIVIVSPYFITGKALRTKLIHAAKRGVEVTVIIPKHSDVRSIDLLRDLFLGDLHKHGINFQMYKSGNLHAKLLLIDKEIFSIGSSNFDYRSFRHMYEINLSGKESTISGLISDFIEETLADCNKFNKTKWLFRSFFNKLIGILLYPIRKLT